MEVANKVIYYSNVLSAIVVNAESSDDPSGDLGRVQVFIPEMQPELFNKYQTYMNISGSKKSSNQLSPNYPWAYNTIDGIKNGDLVFISTVNNTNGKFVIIGKDVHTHSNGIGGSSGALEASDVAELLIRIVLFNENSIGSPPLYDNEWDSNMPLDKCDNYVTYNTTNFSIGLLQWDGSRGYELLYNIADNYADWESCWLDKSCDLFKALKNDVAMGKCNTSNHKHGRTENPDIIKSIQNMLRSDVGIATQVKYARLEMTDLVQAMIDNLGITNPAVLIYVGDFCNQYTYKSADVSSKNPVYKTLYNTASNPSSVYNSVSSSVDKIMNSYETQSSMMKDFETLHHWFQEVYSNSLSYHEPARRNRVAAYIRELYKQGILSQFSAGMTMLGNLNQATYKGITLAYPFESGISEEKTFTGEAWNGTNKYMYTCKVKMPTLYPITSLFGARSFGIHKHTGVDFGCPEGVVLYASHSGTLTIQDSKKDSYKDSKGEWHYVGGYGYHAIITFNNGNDKWEVYYGHLIRGSSRQYGYEVGKSYQIDAGQPIGQVDSTGSSTGNHLHYELRRNGKYVNPLPYLGLGDAHYPLTADMSNYLLE